MSKWAISVVGPRTSWVGQNEKGLVFTTFIKLHAKVFEAPVEASEWLLAYIKTADFFLLFGPRSPDFSVECLDVVESKKQGELLI